MPKTSQRRAVAPVRRLHSVKELKRRRMYPRSTSNWQVFTYPPFLMKADNANSWLTDDFGSTYVRCYQMVPDVQGTYSPGGPLIPLLSTSLYSDEETLIPMQTAMGLLAAILQQSDIITADWSEAMDLSHSMMIVRPEQGDDLITWVVHHEVLTTVSGFSPEQTWQRMARWKPWCKVCYTRHWASEGHVPVDDDGDWEPYAGETFVLSGEDDDLTIRNVSAYM